jgi:5-methylcytosine-specific restriction endonuclease McrA
MAHSKRVKKHRKLLRIIQRSRCFYCEKVIFSDGTVDHVIPRALEGDNSLYNKVLAHSRCNLRKGARLPTYEELEKLKYRNIILTDILKLNQVRISREIYEILRRYGI